jgi:hypothetical protein
MYSESTRVEFIVLVLVLESLVLVLVLEGSVLVLVLGPQVLVTSLIFDIFFSISN